jgi:hypothetical protein
LGELDRYTGIATGVHLGMAVVAAEVFVLGHLVRYLLAAHVCVRTRVCVWTRRTEYALCDTNAIREL